MQRDATEPGLADSHPEGGRLRRRVGRFDATVIIIGNIIGVGIFIMPAVVAGYAQNPWLFLGLWLLGGLIALAGAMSSAELGISMPQAGGDYNFLARTYGLSWGFLYGYLSFLFSYTGSIATLAVGVSRYQLRTIFGDGLGDSLVTIEALGFDLRIEHLVACGIILALTLVNHFGLMKSLILQKLATGLPAVFLLGVGLVILGRAFFGEGDGLAILRENLFAWQSGALTAEADTAAEAAGAGGGMLVLAMASALIPVFFTYTGWNVTLYMAEDIKDPERTLPISMLIGLGIVSVVYFLFCLVLLAAIPFAELMSPYPTDVSARAVETLFGPSAAVIMAVVIAVFILSSLNTTVLSGSRLYLAMARDKIFFRQAGYLHPRHETPSWALWAQALWGCALIIILQEFDLILQVTTLIMLFLSIMTISSVFLLRKRLGAGHSVHAMKSRSLQRALGYPYFPAFYILSTAFILIGSVWNDEHGHWKALAAAAAAGLGFLAYRIWAKRQGPQ